MPDVTVHAAAVSVGRGKVIKSIEKDHECIRRDGQRVPIRLAAYRKNGSYVVSKGPNLRAAEIPCNTLEEVLRYADRGYMIRMQSEIIRLKGESRRVNGLYSSKGIEVVR